MRVQVSVSIVLRLGRYTDVMIASREMLSLKQHWGFVDV